MGTFSQLGLFLINVLFTLYILAVMLRFFLQWVKADFYNPFCQFLMKITNPVVKPLRRVVPGFFGLDWSCVIVMYVLEIIALTLKTYMFGFTPSVGIFYVAIFALIKLALNLFLFAIIVRAILSWFSPDPYNPLNMLLIQLTTPILRPIQRILPPLGGFDLSPLIAIIVLEMILIALGGSAL